MSGRISNAVADAVLSEYLQRLAVAARHRPSWHHPRYNIPPGEELMVVVQRGAERHVRPMRWGLLPAWADEGSAYHPHPDARAETARIKPAFRHAFAHRRGLVVVDSFYEWRRISTRKVPYRFHRADDHPFTLAALWERRGHVAHPLDTVAILTTRANALTAPVHDRMPVILSGAARDRWLDPHATPEPLELLLLQETAEPLVATQVTSHVNSPAHDDAGCWDPA